MTARRWRRSTDPVPRSDRGIRCRRSRSLPASRRRWPDRRPSLKGDPRALDDGPAARRAAAPSAGDRDAGGDHKAAYHAAAVFASNYLMVLADVAARLAREAGAASCRVTRCSLPLMRRTVANYGSGGASKLTGPITRGDVGTVARHLGRCRERIGPCMSRWGKKPCDWLAKAGACLDAAAAIEAFALLLVDDPLGAELGGLAAEDMTGAIGRLMPERDNCVMSRE